MIRHDLHSWPLAQHPHPPSTPTHHLPHPACSGHAVSGGPAGGPPLGSAAAAEAAGVVLSAARDLQDAALGLHDSHLTRFSVSEMQARLGAAGPVCSEHGESCCTQRLILPWKGLPPGSAPRTQRLLLWHAGRQLEACRTREAGRSNVLPTQHLATPCLPTPPSACSASACRWWVLPGGAARCRATLPPLWTWRTEIFTTSSRYDESVAVVLRVSQCPAVN